MAFLKEAKEEIEKRGEGRSQCEYGQRKEGAP